MNDLFVNLPYIKQNNKAELLIDLKSLNFK